MITYSYIVIGTSAAGLAAVQKIRSLDPVGSILCLSQEAELPYNKCFLVDCLAQEKDLEAVFTKPFSYFKEHNIQLMLNKKVLELDRNQKKIICSDGQAFFYHKLLIATGAQPLILHEPKDGVFSFYTLADVVLFKAWIEQALVKHVVIIGSGLTGIEVADALQVYKIKVTVIEQQEHVLKRHMDQKAAEVLQNVMEKKNCNVLTKTSVKNIVYEQGKVVGVLLSDNTMIPADAVIMALGSVLNSDFAEKSGLVCQEGAIVTDQCLQTNDASICAAGDVALVTHKLTGQKVRTSLWPDAVQQGMYAAFTLCGQPKIYPGIFPMVHSVFFGFSFYSAGIIHADDSFDVRISYDSGYEKVILDRQKVVQGFILLTKDKKKIIALKHSLLYQIAHKEY